MWPSALASPATRAVLASGLIAALCGAAPAGERGREALDMRAASWKQVVFQDEKFPVVPKGEAAVFEAGSDPAQGPTLAVGPWLAGIWGARYEHRTAVARTTGTVRGAYRTRDLVPGQAGVTVIFHGLPGRDEKIVHRLASAEAWTEFEFPVRHAPLWATSYTVAVGLLETTRGRVEFARIAVDPAATPAGFGPPPAPERVYPRRTFEGSAFYRLVQHEGRSWLVTPRGDPFYSVGVVGTSGRGAGRDVEEGLARAAYLRAHGFNSLAGWTNPREWLAVNQALEARGDAPLPLFFTLHAKSLKGEFERLVDRRGRTAAGGPGFPDPFDPAFERAYEAAAAAVVARLGDAPWFAGWFADNELPLEELYRHVYSRHAALAFRAFLEGRHRTIDALNAAWGRRFASFDALMAEKPDPATSQGGMLRDFLDFERVVVERYVDVTLRSIRRHDAGRLVFSNRFNVAGLETCRRVLDLFGRYDGIGVNLYPENRGAGLSGAERALLQWFASSTGKPVLIGEWSVPGLDSGLYAPRLGQSLDWSFNGVVGTQQERAAQAALLSVAFFDLPFVVGAHWFCWDDFDTPSRRANRGLVRASGEPWEPLAERLGEANRMIAPPR